jgi:hypothetical protein
MSNQLQAHAQLLKRDAARRNRPHHPMAFHVGNSGLLVLRRSHPSRKPRHHRATFNIVPVSENKSSAGPVHPPDEMPVKVGQLREPVAPAQNASPVKGKRASVLASSCRADRLGVRYREVSAPLAITITAEQAGRHAVCYA